ncbi:hypothetical protein GCM10010381_65340 [Streptomyces xantholiticus]|nr:hypothetical protein GCM10010381_65340 [Streptomyces xantholiticus]
MDMRNSRYAPVGQAAGAQREVESRTAAAWAAWRTSRQKPRNRPDAALKEGQHAAPAPQATVAVWGW